jgi:hypothetical protein
MIIVRSLLPIVARNCVYIAATNMGIQASGSWESSRRHDFVMLLGRRRSPGQRHDDPIQCRWAELLRYDGDDEHRLHR